MKRRNAASVGIATRRRVRLVQVARLLEIGEHVANARGREIEPVFLGQRAAAHRLTGGDELGNRSVEDASCAIVELAHCFSMILDAPG